MNDSIQNPGELLTNVARAQLSDAAKPVIEQTKVVAEEQKSVGAVKARTVAKAVSRAADELQSQLPIAADYIRNAAIKLDEASAALEERSFDELADTFRRFAASQPAAFFGAAALAGFALSRFFKSSAETGRSTASFQKGV
jgi:hypothetical protein